MDLQQQFNQFIVSENLFQKNHLLVLAVSGGVDSVVLCELCHLSRYQFVIAHCNFQLRGAESERDEAFVKQLGDKYGVQVLVKRFDTAAYATERKLGIQEAARNLRYSWFLEICTDGSLDAIKAEGLKAFIDYTRLGVRVLTAHHANDNIETLLMNFFKGTGIKGLQGIQPISKQRPYLIRPLLFAEKKGLLDFAKQRQLSFVEDSSNTSDKYTRNYFRNQLIPGIKKVFPAVEENLLDNLQRFKDIATLYRQSIDLYKKKLLEYKGEEVHIPILKLLKAKPLNTILYEIIKDFNFSSAQINEVINLLDAETGKCIFSSSHTVFKNRKWLIITPTMSATVANILIEEHDNNIDFSKGQLKIQQQDITSFKLQTAASLAQVNADLVKFPLLLRRWKQGDYFYPLGMSKKKKLSRFFIDQKLSLTEKVNTWVIEMDKKIIWIVGMRIDDRFKITSKTMNVLVIALVETNDLA